jgi:subtilisin family serine protease
LWGLNNTGQDGGSPDVDINGLEASGVTQGNSEVVVAIIDDGVDFKHPDLQGQAWTNPDEIPNNNTDDDANGYDYDEATDKLPYTPKKSLTVGSHTVKVEATDAEQNEGWRQWTFKVLQRR